MLTITGRFTDHIFEIGEDVMVVEVRGENDFVVINQRGEWDGVKMEDVSACETVRKLGLHKKM